MADIGIYESSSVLVTWLTFPLMREAMQGGAVFTLTYVSRETTRDGYTVDRYHMRPLQGDG